MNERSDQEPRLHLETMTAKKRTYLDYAATAPLHPRVRTAMEPYESEAFGNPASTHAYGRDARAAVEAARDRIRKALGAEGTIVFTGTGTESDNLAVLGFAHRHPDGCLVHSSIEHSAVRMPARALREGGYDVRVAPVDTRGVLDVEALAELLPTDGRPTLVSLMWANNETGVVQPVDRVAALCRERGARLHTDAVQAFGKLPLDLGETPVDMVTLSGHKLGGPKGVGVLFRRQAVEIEPIIRGGGHQEGLRAGTEDVWGCVGMAEAAALVVEQRSAEAERLSGLRDRLEAGLLASHPEIVVNGGDAPERLPNVTNISVPNVDLEGTLTALDMEGLCVSAGSACSSGTPRPSHVVEAMGRQGDLARNTIRFSLGWATRPEDVDHALEVFPRVVDRLRELAGQVQG